MKKEYGFALVTIFFWSSTYSVNALMIRDIDAMQLMLYYSTAASAFLFVLCAATGRMKLPAKTDRCEWALLTALGLINFLYNYLSNLCLLYLKAQQASVINYFWPALLMVFSCILLKEKMHIWKAMAIVLSLFGVAVVITGGQLNALGQANLKGVAFSISGAVCYALFSVLNMKVKTDKFAAMLLYYLISTAASFACLRINATPLQPLEKLQWAGILWCGALVYGLSYALWAKALDIGNTAVVSNLAYMTPVLSLVWIYFVFGETIELAAIVGLMLILSGIFLQVIGEKKYEVRLKRSENNV